MIQLWQGHVNKGDCGSRNQLLLLREEFLDTVVHLALHPSLQFHRSLHSLIVWNQCLDTGKHLSEHMGLLVDDEISVFVKF